MPVCRLFAFLLLAGLSLTACAHKPERLDRVAISETARADPWESTNRRIFKLSSDIDKGALLPVTEVYRAIIPPAPRRGIGNAYDTLHEPTNFANAVAQGKIKSAFRALDRILVNVGLGLGVADHATEMGLDEQEHDFGQTMAVWGMPSGPFVMMPLLGPSTVRDGAGFFVDFLLDPVDYIEGRVLNTEERLAKLGVRVLDTRSSLRDQGEQLLTGSADPYATVRSAWLQLRRYQIFDGNPPAVEDEEDIPPPPDMPATNATPSAPAAVDVPAPAQPPQAPQP